MISKSDVSECRGRRTGHALRNVRRVKLRQYLNLLLDILDFVLSTLQVNYFDGHRLLCALVIAVGWIELRKR